MEHVVFFTAPDGASASRRVPALEDAVRLVEHLRNVEGVHEVSVHPLGEQVPLAFRAWYRVEVPAAEAPTGQPVVDVPAQVQADQPVDPPHEAADDAAPGAADDAERSDEPVHDVVADPVPAVAGPREDVKSLGFFAS